MSEISSKTTEVAEPLTYRHTLNIQFFAGDDEAYPSLDESPEFRDDAKEFNAKMDKFVADRAPKETPKETPVETKNENEPEKVTQEAAKPEVAVPDDKPKQDSETNRAFQEMRQKLEAAEKAKSDVEAKAKKADELIAAQFGKQGITTVEQYDQWIQQGKIDEENERYKEAGLTPEEIEKIRRYDELQLDTETQKIQRQQQEYTSQWQALYAAYPDIVETSNLFNEGKEPEWYNEAMKAEIARGASPIAAYRNAHFETILQSKLQSTKEVAKQEALNSLNSKNHIKPSGTESGDVDHVEIDAETMRMYRSLNKGKTDAQIRAWHKKNAM